MGLLVAGSSLQTARIPELSPVPVDIPLTLADEIPYYSYTDNKTRRTTFQKLSDLLEFGAGGGAHAPVVYGGELIYEVPQDVADETQVVSIPSLAGKDFTLERGGLPLIPLLPDESNADVAEYDILDAGGFQLLKDLDYLHGLERFKLNIFSLIGAQPSTSSPGSSSFIKGKKLVTTNVTLDPVNDVNKVIQIRADTAAVTVTLPPVEDIAENSFFPIETLITNTKPAKIIGTGGQFFYLNNSSKTELYMHPGEILWLFRDDDGLYVINDFNRHYEDLGDPQSSYKVKAKRLLCKGQSLNRVDYPRLWEFIQTLGTSLISETDWNITAVYRQGNTYTTVPPGGAYETIPFPNRGCFSMGDGSTSFRMPDLMNMALRSVKSEAGTDTERYANKPGNYQPNFIGQYIDTRGDGQGDVITPDTYQAGPFRFKTRAINPGRETVMDNVGIFWTMKY
jgi:hypothetical protein